MSIALQRIVARLDLLSDAARRAQAEIWSSCLMPIGRPVGSKEWITAMETRPAMTLAPHKNVDLPLGGPSSQEVI